MAIYVSGSLAFDRIMTFDGNFQDHVLMDKLHTLSVSFMVDNMNELRGGCAGNIAYTLALLEEKPLIVASAGRDFAGYAAALEEMGLSTEGIRRDADIFTALCYITTDVKADNALLREMLAANVAESFNRITIDGDMSTNDTTIVMANGRSGVELKAGTPEAEEFRQALLAVMQRLAREMVMDGEGATKFIHVEIEHARSTADAKLCAEAVANSLLCKTAWFGGDPNWGRVVAALGYSGAKFDPEKTDIYYDNMPVVRNGGDAGTPESALCDIVKQREFTVRVNLHDGDDNYWVWTSDVSYEYVKINADYHT